MSFPSTAVWEMRTTASDTNGGGFNAARGGTDYTLQDAAQATGTVTVSGTTATATTGIFTAQMVGNFITDGTSWRELTAFTSSTIMTVDATVAWTAVSIKVGGALATINKFAALYVAGNLGFAKYHASNVYSTASNISMSVAGCLIGYDTNRTINNTDNKPTIQAAVGCTNIISVGTFFSALYNLLLDANNIANTCCTLGSAISQVSRCKLQKFAVSSCTGTGIFVENEITSNKAGATSGTTVNGQVENNNIHDLTCAGMILSGNTTAVRGNTVANCSGASSDGISITYATTLQFNTIYNVGRDGIRITGGQPQGLMVRDNVISVTGAFGMNLTSGSSTQGVMSDYNAFYSTTSGNRNGLATPTHDIVLTADPFVNSAGADYTPNTIAGGGASLKAAASNGSDIGAVQHVDSGTTGTVNLLRGKVG